MKKKSLVTMVASLALVGAVGVGSTLAYLSSTTGTLVNTFSTASGYTGEEQAVQIQETNVDTKVKTSYGETVGEALQRETFEELGFCADNPELLYKYVFESDVERELVHTFRCVAEHSDIKFAPDEIEDGRFFRFEEIESLIAKSLTTPNFVMEFNMLKQQAFLKTKE